MKKFVFVFLSVSILSGCAAVMTQQLSDARREFANDKFTESAENFSGGADIQSQNNLDNKKIMGAIIFLIALINKNFNS